METTNRIAWFKRWQAISFATVIFVALMVVGAGWVRAADDGGEETLAEELTGEVESASAMGELDGGGQIALFIAIASTVGISCIAAGYAVAKVGAAALGAASERPEILGRALIFVGLAEGVAIYGLIIAIMLIVTML